MEKLLQEQEEIGEKIMIQARNYNKDGESRKTKPYLERRIEELKKLYSDYLARDDKIITMVPPIKEEHPYRATRKTVAEINSKLLAEMRRRLNDWPTTTPLSSMDNPEHVNSPIKEPSNNGSIATPLSTMDKLEHVDDSINELSNNGPPTTPTQSSSRDNQQQLDNLNKELSHTNQKLLKKQNVLMRSMYRKINSIEEALGNNNSPMEYIKLKIEQLSQEIRIIDTLHIEILVEIEEEEQTAPYFQNNYYETLKDRVDSIIVRLQRSQKEETTIPTIPSGEARVNLPKIQIPMFNGDYEQWSSFNDIFTELVHNNNQLSNTIKITYLKSSVQKGAAQLISHLSTTVDNYTKTLNSKS